MISNILFSSNSWKKQSRLYPVFWCRISIAVQTYWILRQGLLENVSVRKSNQAKVRGLIKPRGNSTTFSREWKFPAPKRQDVMYFHDVVDKCLLTDWKSCKKATPVCRQCIILHLLANRRLICPTVEGQNGISLWPLWTEVITERKKNCFDVHALHYDRLQKIWIFKGSCHDTRTIFLKYATIKG